MLNNKTRKTEVIIEFALLQFLFIMNLKQNYLIMQMKFIIYYNKYSQSPQKIKRIPENT